MLSIIFEYCKKINICCTDSNRKKGKLFYYFIFTFKYVVIKNHTAVKFICKTAKFVSTSYDLDFKFRTSQIVR